MSLNSSQPVIEQGPAVRDGTNQHPEIEVHFKGEQQSQTSPQGTVSLVGEAGKEQGTGEIVNPEKPYDRRI